MLMKLPRWGFWCECWTENLTEQGPLALVASFDAYSAPQADRWVAIALETISPALDVDASSAAWEWMYDGRIDTRRALLRAEPCTVSLTHVSTRITWTIQPVLFLPLAHRQGTEHPACAHDFTPHPEE
ncbi:hypothetical protein [Streptomyces rubradiris]|uniref:Uncharacterized protein n=1 Tax=Streptomyces rubradiris TaxID=285531 RepID=A0ABQ3RP86_STRRR|nr:hypothetical protein [Streptomyces rubradiris]GHH12020.1 hypothetical protein GCM10018792_36990 [Streptomyces rubradiris]GHI57674.1 hypothetical protein Srubr_75200 [Streptomyces rubradiris]